MKLPELLAPAGNFEKLKTAVHYGADAVYLGGEEYSLRAHAANFGREELPGAVAYAHERRVKVYVTVNIFAHNRDLAAIPDYLRTLQAAQVDGLIISDPGIIRLARKTVPKIPIHLSTQANVTNLESAQFWVEQGAARLNLARELSLEEIRSIRSATAAEIEIFVHGALCISYSGRCLLSLYLAGRDANRGDCAHPCRYSYRLEEEKRPGQLFPVEEDSRGTYIFNSKDLCLLRRLPDLVAAGADSLKIEGRMKSVYYVGAIVRLYRAALDILAAEDGPPSHRPPLPAIFTEELRKIGSRGYTENFLDHPPASEEMLYAGPKIIYDYAPVGIVRGDGELPLIETRNPIKPGEQIEYLGEGLQNPAYEITAILDPEGKPLEKANPNALVRLVTEPAATGWQPHALIRKRLAR
jgi:putative protease